MLPFCQVYIVDPLQAVDLENKTKAPLLVLSIFTKASATLVCFPSSVLNLHVGKLFQKILQSMNKGSNENFALEFFIRCTSITHFIYFSFDVTINHNIRTHNA